MNLRALAYLLLPTAVLAGCSSSHTGGDDDDSNDRCDDPRYGDGVCDPQLSCEVPDIDCFQTFETDAEAATWWRTTGGPLVGQSYPSIAETDPRFDRVRKALDDGWAAFRDSRPVGELRDATPALVIVDKPSIENAAFVIGDHDHANQPFVVMVETPALELDVPDDALLAVMMHELQHAIGLHKLGDNQDRLRAFYAAPSDSEPIGRDQRDDVDIHVLGDAWRTAASQIGPYSAMELGGLPLGGIFRTMLVTVVNQGVQQQPANCTDAANKLNAVSTQLGSLLDPLDQSIAGDPTPLEQPITDALASLRDTCLATASFDLIDVGAEVAGVTREQFRADLDANDLALVENKPFVDGLVAIVSDRRASMLDAEDVFSESTGQPWQQLRYFSVEEDADDVSSFVMHDAGKDHAAAAGFFLAVLPAETAHACSDAVASGFPGYGVDLTDEHHAVCWRVGHLDRLPTEDDRDRARAHRTVRPHTLSRTIRVPGRIPTPHKPSDNIAD